MTSRLPRLLAASALVAAIPAAAQIITWTGGDILTLVALGNPPTVDAGETLVIDTAGLHDFNGKAVTNDGTVSWLAGQIRAGGGASFTNNAAFNDSATSQMNNAYTGGWAFHNTATGTYTKSTGTTLVAGGVAFNNQGLLDATGGTLTLQGGGNLAGGTIQAASGATVNLDSAFTGAGTITFAGAGAINFTGSLSAGSTLEGPLQWISGQFNGVGTTTFGASATINAVTTNLHDFNQRALVNQGTFNWSEGQIRAGGSASFTNHATFHDTASNQMNNAYTGGWAFHNAADGTYLKTAGATLIAGGVAFNNAGMVNVSNSSLTLQGGGNLSGGTLQAGTGGLIDLASNFVVNGTVTLSGPGEVRFSSGTISGATTIEGPLNWTAGDFNGVGTTTFGTTAVISVSTASQHDFNQRALVNEGTVNWSAGAIRAGGGASFTNNAAFNDLASSQLNNDYTGGWAFNNTASGTYTKTTGSTLVAGGVAFNNAGMVHVSNSSLTLQGGGNLAGGTLFAGSGGTIILASSFNNPGVVTFAGPGEVRFQSGTMFGLTTFEGPMNWTAGNFNGAGTTTFGSSAVVRLTTTALHDFNQRTLVNQGFFDWQDGQIRAGGGASFVNDGDFLDTASSQMNNAYTGGWTFVNSASGQYNKTSGATLIAGGVAFQNLGTVDVSGGSLTLQGGGNLAGGTLIARSGASVFLDSSFHSPGVVTFAGDGNIFFASGTMTGATTFEGPLNWTAGNFNGTGTTTFGTTANVLITTTALHDLNQRALVNHGSFTWIDGQIRAGGGASFANFGVFTDAGLSDQFNNAYTGGWTFTNKAGGLYAKTGTGVTTVAGGVGFVNEGTLGLEHGTLLMQGGLTLQATSELLYTLSGPATDTGYGLLSVSTAVALNGTLELMFGAGFDTTATFGQSLTLLTASSLSGAFTNVASGTRLVSADGLGSYVVHYGAGSPFGVNNVVITGFVSVPEPSTWAMLILGLAAVAITFHRRRR